MKNTENNIQVELHVDDFEQVKLYYKKLGFTVVWERQPEGVKGYLVLRNETDTVINFWGGNQEVYSHEYFSQFDRSTPRGYGVEIVITTDQELEVLEAVMGDSVVEPLRLRPWGLRDFRVRDPFGYYLRITSRHDVTDPKNAVS